MDIQEIFEYLPHRAPFLMVDRVVSVEPGESIHGYKCVTFNEPFFEGHFPGHPVMPGLLIIEAMAQLGGILAFKTRGRRTGEGYAYYLGSVDKARFKRPVTPGDRLDMEVRILSAKRSVMKFDCKAFVDQQLVCEAEVICVEKEMGA
jgi:3-hydroxyacyl-[acyl-carrier-protein] dehydratase